MDIQKIMTRDIQLVRADTSLKQAAHIMAEFNIGELPVGTHERIDGLITDRDITIRATAEGRDPATTPVSDIMTRDLIWCYEDQSLEEVARLMEANQVRRILIKNHLDQLTGVVSLGDFAVRRDTEEIAEEVLHCVSEPPGQQDVI